MQGKKRSKGRSWVDRLQDQQDKKKGKNSQGGKEKTAKGKELTKSAKAPQGKLLHLVYMMTSMLRGSLTVFSRVLKVDFASIKSC